jgi:hypothetical protein
MNTDDRDLGFPATAPGSLSAPHEVALWDSVEIVMSGPSDGNPFVETELSANVRTSQREYVMRGFYDGEGREKVRLLADAVGPLTFEILSNVPSLDALTGSARHRSPRG